MLIEGLFNRQNRGEMMKHREDELDIIYKKYYKDVFYYCTAITGNRDMAEEITQNTFYKAVISIHKFRGDCDIRAWLCRIAKNDYLNHLRKEKHFNLSQNYDELIDTIPDEMPSVVNQIEDTETAEEIRKQLAKMEEPYKEVFTLRVLQEMSYTQIAKLYGKTENWARVTYYRAKAKIAERL